MVTISPPVGFPIKGLIETTRGGGAMIRTGSLNGEQTDPLQARTLNVGSMVV
jgi:hypothetical protein